MDISVLKQKIAAISDKSFKQSDVIDALSYLKCIATYGR